MSIFSSFNRCRFLGLAGGMVLLASMGMLAPTVTCADEYTGLRQNDPKDLLPYDATPTPPPQPTGTDILFLPMPTWARGVLMPPLPEALKPMGKKPVVATAAKPVPASLEPPRDTSAGSDTTTSPAPKTTPAETPAMITVSPFLQWVKSNPQAAATEAHQQANGYRPPVPLPGSNFLPGAASGETNPYWLPPMIDSSSVDTSTAGPSAVRGSSAIYSTPQR